MPDIASPESGGRRPTDTFAEGHVVLTLGAHTGHIVTPIAHCKDATTATLFAAAPDLLAFVERVARMAHSGDADAVMPLDEDDTGTLENLILRARAALARAGASL